MADVIDSYQYIDEEHRLQSSLARRVEYYITIDALGAYIHSGTKMLDCGCGAGIYSIYFSKMGADVTAVDLVPKHIARLRQIAAEENLTIVSAVGNAANLSGYRSGSYDVVLCMGPLYHLISEADQEKCLLECIRVVKPDGIIAFSYISPYSVFPCVMRGDPSRISEELVQKIISEKRISSQEACCFWTDNFFHDPEEIERWMKRAGLDIVDHLATDGQSIAFQNTINDLNDNSFLIWLQYHKKICRIHSVLGTSNHGLIITRRKG